MPFRIKRREITFHGCIDRVLLWYYKCIYSCCLGNKMKFISLLFGFVKVGKCALVGEMWGYIKSTNFKKNYF